MKKGYTKTLYNKPWKLTYGYLSRKKKYYIKVSKQGRNKKYKTWKTWYYSTKIMMQRKLKMMQHFSTWFY